MLLHSLAAVAFALLSPCNAQDDLSASPSLSEVLAAHKNLSSFSALLTEQLPDTLKAIEERRDAEYNSITVLALSNLALDRIQYNPALSAIWANNDTTEMSRVIAYHVLLGKWTTDTLSTNFTFLPSMTMGSNFSNVSGGQRVGAVLQNGNPDTPEYKWELLFISGAAERSVASIQDIPFAGGIVQVIDNPLNPPAPLVPTAEDFNPANYPFAINSFLGALYSTPDNSLQKYLNDTKDVTIFVPANVAFETVSDAITSMSNETRMDLLSYHVLAGSVLPNGGPLYSSDFQDGAILPMHDGQNANMMFYPNSYFLNSARIVQADIMIYNGVVHVIDVLLDPDQKDTKPNPTSATQAPVLAAQTDGSFNVSQAPFTTYLPNYIPTDIPTTSSSTSRTSSTFSASQTGSSSSGVKTATIGSNPWFGVMGSWILVAVGTAGACLLL